MSIVDLIADREARIWSPAARRRFGFVLSQERGSARTTNHA